MFASLAKADPAHLSQYCHKLPPPLLPRYLVIRLTPPRIFASVPKGT
jgi:hypothetical protein